MERHFLEKLKPNTQVWNIKKDQNVATKGQLISECLFDVLNLPKNQRKIWQISALETKKWSNHKIKAHYDEFDTNYVQIILNNITRCLHFVDLTTFYILGQKCVKFFVVFLENLRLSKQHSEINWPLLRYLTKQSSENFIPRGIKESKNGNLTFLRDLGIWNIFLWNFRSHK
jgi:hypothetical protein